jgi:hypothetical protein
MKELQPELAARFLFFVLAGDCIYQLHSRWFAIPREAFHTLHYALMAATKITLILFFLLPWIAIRIVLKQK